MGCGCCKEVLSCIQTQEKEELVLYGGLPNIGNTCYLNSTLQLLFSMKKLRNKLNSKGPCTSLLRGIFFAITISQNRSRKQALLEELGKNHIQQKTYHKYNSQQDALDAFIAITQTLIEQNSQISQLVTIISHKLCKCVGSISLIHQQLLLKLQQTCQLCREILQLQVIEGPEYLIMVPDYQDKKYGDEIVLSMKNSSQPLIYEITSLIKYSGNRRSGHYIAYIKTPDNKWLQLNDQILNYRQNRPKQAFLCVYKRKEVIVQHQKN